jgi:hypothetical protein
MFAVEGIDDVVARLRSHGAELLDDIAQYEESKTGGISSSALIHTPKRPSDASTTAAINRSLGGGASGEVDGWLAASRCANVQPSGCR